MSGLDVYKRRNNLTDDDIAAILGIDRTYATRIRQGERTPPLYLALAIYRHFGVAMGQLKDKSPKEIATLRKAMKLLDGKTPKRRNGARAA